MERVDQEVEHTVMHLEMRETHWGNGEHEESVSTSQSVIGGGEDGVGAGAMRCGSFNGWWQRGEEDKVTLAMQMRWLEGLR